MSASSSLPQLQLFEHASGPYGVASRCKEKRVVNAHLQHSVRLYEAMTVLRQPYMAMMLETRCKQHTIVRPIWDFSCLVRYPSILRCIRGHHWLGGKEGGRQGWRGNTAVFPPIFVESTRQRGPLGALGRPAINWAKRQSALRLWPTQDT